MATIGQKRKRDGGEEEEEEEEEVKEQPKTQKRTVALCSQCMQYEHRRFDRYLGKTDLECFHRHYTEYAKGVLVGILDGGDIKLPPVLSSLIATYLDTAALEYEFDPAGSHHYEDVLDPPTKEVLLGNAPSAIRLASTACDCPVCRDPLCQRLLGASVTREMDIFDVINQVMEAKMKAVDDDEMSKKKCYELRDELAAAGVNASILIKTKQGTNVVGIDERWKSDTRIAHLIDRPLLRFLSQK